MEDKINEKQQYLRDEILQIGYNPAHFASYLCGEREDGDDIDNWSVDSLVDVVKQYKMDNPDPEAVNQADYETSDPSDDENYTEE
jgi:hypothetical protein